MANFILLCIISTLIFLGHKYVVNRIFTDCEDRLARFKEDIEADQGIKSVLLFNKSSINQHNFFFDYDILLQQDQRPLGVGLGRRHPVRRDHACDKEAKEPVHSCETYFAPTPAPPVQVNHKQHHRTGHSAACGGSRTAVSERDGLYTQSDQPDGPDNPGPAGSATAGPHPGSSASA